MIATNERNPRNALEKGGRLWNMRGVASSGRIDDPDQRNQSGSIIWKVTPNFRGIVVIANPSYATVRALDGDLSAILFEPNLRAFQRG
jgi:hypothetical protein